MKIEVVIKFLKVNNSVNVFAAVYSLFLKLIIAKPVCYQKSAISYLMVNYDK